MHKFWIVMLPVLFLAVEAPWIKVVFHCWNDWSCCTNASVRKKRGFIGKCELMGTWDHFYDLNIFSGLNS